MVKSSEGKAALRGRRCRFLRHPTNSIGYANYNIAVFADRPPSPHRTRELFVLLPEKWGGGTPPLDRGKGRPLDPSGRASGRVVRPLDSSGRESRRALIGAPEALEKAFRACIHAGYCKAVLPVEKKTTQIISSRCKETSFRSELKKKVEKIRPRQAAHGGRSCMPRQLNCIL